MISKLPLLTFLIACLALGLQIIHPKTATPPHRETAYERVMRTRTLHCGYALWPVSEEIDPNTKQLKGVVPDFTEALGQKLGLKIEWTEEVVWGQQAEALATGKIDAMCTTDGPYVYTAATVLDYTEPMAYFPEYIYGRENAAPILNIDTLNTLDITFSAIEGDISLAMAMDSFPKAHRLELPGSDDPSLIMVNIVDKKADVTITDPLTIDHFNRNNKKKLKKLYDQPMGVINMSFSVGKGEGDLLQMLNQGFLLLQGLGISDQILNKYDPEHKLFYRPVQRWTDQNPSRAISRAK